MPFSARSFASHRVAFRLRSRLQMSQVEGGWPHFFRRFLEVQLFEPCGLSTGGVAVMLDGQPTLLYARLSNVLADGDGHMKVWDWKGASSLKPCLKHVNVMKKACVCTVVNPHLLVSGSAASHDQGRYRSLSYANPQPCTRPFAGFEPRRSDDRLRGDRMFGSVGVQSPTSR